MGDKNHVIKYDHESGELITLEYDVAYNNYPVTYVAFDEATGILATVTNIKGNYDVELSYIKFFDINNGFREVASYKTEPVKSGITLRDGVFCCDKGRFESSEGTRLDDAELGLQDGEYIVSYNTDSFVKYDIGTYVLCTRYGAEAYTFDGVCGYIFARDYDTYWAVCYVGGRAIISEFSVAHDDKLSVRTAWN